jgi:hypothetical protein
MLDCRVNIDFAYQLYTERGFEPWTTFKKWGVSVVSAKLLIQGSVIQLAAM